MKTVLGEFKYNSIVSGIKAVSAEFYTDEIANYVAINFCKVNEGSVRSIEVELVAFDADDKQVFLQTLTMLENDINSEGFTLEAVLPVECVRGTAELKSIVFEDSSRIEGGWILPFASKTFISKWAEKYLIYGTSDISIPKRKPAVLISKSALEGVQEKTVVLQSVSEENNFNNTLWENALSQDVEELQRDKLYVKTINCYFKKALIAIVVACLVAILLNVL